MRGPNQFEGKRRHGVRAKKGRLTHGCVGYWNVGLDKENIRRSMSRFIRVDRTGLISSLISSPCEDPASAQGGRNQSESVPASIGARGGYGKICGSIPGSRSFGRAQHIELT